MESFGDACVRAIRAARRAFSFAKALGVLIARIVARQIARWIAPRPTSSYVASWSGPPTPGIAGPGQLCLCHLVTCSGDPLRVLSRGCRGRLNSARVERDAHDGRAYVLGATLTLTPPPSTIGAKTVRDVTDLVYTLPAHMRVTPSELAALLYGTSRSALTAPRLDVVTMRDVDCVLTFESDEVFERASIFSNDECNGRQ